MVWSLYKVRLIGISSLFIMLFGVWLPQIVSPDRLVGFVFGADVVSGSDYLSIHFLDVGQGDATYIETTDGVQILVDGSGDRRVLDRLSEHMAPLDRQLDMIVATHAHSDHIGGLIDVLERFRVDHILITENQIDTETSRRFFALVDDLSDTANVWYARGGQKFALGASTTLSVLSPMYDATDMNADASSITLKLEHKDTAVLLTGDAPKSIERYLVEEYGSGLESDILKLGHHGSRTSTAGSFLDTVNPHYAIVSAGIDSRHGHPHEEVVGRVKERGIEIMTTQTSGTISFDSDGTQFMLIE